ncbi:MAG: TonB C-terminal domain-containing protein [Nitrospira sp.]|nr:TonB C-terminal domain-containing protein [Nitrospira sp.]
MVYPVLTRLMVVVGLLSTPLYQAPARASVQSQPRPATPQAVSAEPQWATFDITGSNGSGSLQIGQPLELSITLGGTPHDSMPIVAICESAHFESQIVTLKPEPSALVMNATTTLVPVAHDRLSPAPHVSRLHVTFARSTDTKFERVLTRIIYLTMGDTTPAGDDQASLTTHQDPPIAPPSEIDPAAGHAEPLPGAIPLVSEEVVEEDLIPSRSTQPTPGYWDQVRDLLNRGWTRATGHMPASSFPHTVHMQFRLYPGGHAQLLEIADGSGITEIDQAGIRAIADAQPFPPFPLGVGIEPIEIHVRLQTGSQSGVGDFRTSTPQQLGRTISAPKH